MSTFNSSEIVASCKATTVSQPSSTTQPANSSTHSVGFGYYTDSVKWIWMVLAKLGLFFVQRAFLLFVD